jgi:hypothetical protein
MSVELTAISETDRTFFSPDYQTDCDRARAEEGTQTPSLPRTPSRLRRAPQRFCQSQLVCRRAHSLSIGLSYAVVHGWGALGLSIGMAASIVVTEPIHLGLISRVYVPTKRADDLLLLSMFQ